MSCDSLSARGALLPIDHFLGGLAGVAEPPELFQLKCLSHASRAVTHLNQNNTSAPQV
jgi:hypothetical protein